ncbi:MAG: phosphoglucosamine mutase [Candidatus Diapherotrites archaeon]|nr:phosphoglucosamine mutase [Candidatus Diapherotrites archaeon]
MPENLFGTDGIRGVANEEPLTPETLVKIGKAIAAFFMEKNGGSPKKIVIGKDTRLSGYMLETALTSGIVSMGVDVMLVGPMPTPAIAHLTKSLNADAGIVLSASHNHARDNGVKIFDSRGIKLCEKDEKEIEALVENNSFPKSGAIGKAYRVDDARGRYIEFVKAAIGNQSLRGLKICVDCANGAAYSLAQRIFEELGAVVVCINDRPDGENINLDCGAIHPKVVSGLVKARRADAGVAFDGDADRAVFCDEKGEVIHGDQVLALFALSLKKTGKLRNDSIVATRASNQGFFEAMHQNQVNVVQCDVGDKNVIEAMLAKNISFGGEQSGHVIFSDHSTTGDGLVTALELFRILRASGKKLSELTCSVKLVPQITVNVAVREKKPFESMPLAQREISQARQSLGASGRVLVRYSGTEKKARVMVECDSEKTALALAEKIAEAVKKEAGE